MKMKSLVENKSSGVVDALGLSRATLCNDTLLAKLDELWESETIQEAGETCQKVHSVLSTGFSMQEGFSEKCNIAR